MTDNETLTFDEDPIEIKVKISGRNYLLKEADGAVGIFYRNSLINNSEMDAEGHVVKIKDGSSIQPLLLTMCLFEEISDANGTSIRLKPVPSSVIRGWPDRIQKTLFNKLKEISNLDNKDEANEDDDDVDKNSAKNSPDDTEGGSDSPAT